MTLVTSRFVFVFLKEIEKESKEMTDVKERNVAIQKLYLVKSISVFKINVTLAQGDKIRFWGVKMKMRDTLLQNIEFYKGTFSDCVLYDDLKSNAYYAIEKEVGSEEIK
ncbi:hypothetical protein BCV72DRAFT_240012 [Rhizopus microsporus var. microsporus]|uniref:Uncharacterized protein n=2 Tax=Rhizopus microsporus TaxID=58291 RepID=A0A2G4T5Q2_RHIZD|nr:uncharacterized protein RHIMIDRAFT_300748 [Rhizopus microsporus ATCC 52813]ORE09019.1 hypothetical protein BCV72DRAFT_240012 [Rhizopus microsporus var. microsporus]PHZ16353.1 hypothetical protein RHIMIDRAFT_300748 [Rhizopus microsporus ATCC 52813]